MRSLVSHGSSSGVLLASGMVLLAWAGIIFYVSPLDLPSRQALSETSGTLVGATLGCGRAHNCVVTYTLHTTGGDLELSQEVQASKNGSLPLFEPATPIVALTSPHEPRSTFRADFWDLSVNGVHVLSYDDAVAGIAEYHRKKRKYGYIFLAGAIATLGLGVSAMNKHL